MNAIYTGPQQFVKATTNAQLWYVGEADDIIPIVHLWGACARGVARA